MSRFNDEYDDYPDYPNAGDLWHANAQRALKGKKGRKALAEMREALMALPEHRLIEGAMCTVGRRREPTDQDWHQQDLNANIADQGEGVCAIGAFLWHRKVKAGATPEEAFDSLPTLLGVDGDGDWQTANQGKAAGLTFTLAWSLAQRNDLTYAGKTPEERFEAFVAWIDEQLAEEPQHV